MKKILIIRTYPSILDPDGYNIQEIGFAKALVRAGCICDVVLFNGSNPDQIKQILVKESESGYVKIYLRHGFGILKNGFFPGLGKIVQDYDILQVHEYDQITSWMYYACYKEKPVVVYHGPYYDDFNRGYNLKCRIFDKTFLKFKNIEKTICFTKSKAAAKFLEDKGFKNAIPIGVGLDIENFNDSEISSECERDLSETVCRKLLYVGKIEPRRNPYLLLEILEKLSVKYDDIQMTVIGSGDQSYLSDWKIKAQPLMDKGVLTYIEKMEQTKLKSIYQKADLLVFPSNYDIFGMVILEAMYFDLPVISSDNGGSDTLITDGLDGIIINDFSAETWVQKISKLHDDINLYNSIRKNLVAKEHTVYTWDGIARRYLEVLNEI